MYTMTSWSREEKDPYNKNIYCIIIVSSDTINRTEPIQAFKLVFDVLVIVNTKSSLTLVINIKSNLKHNYNEWLK